MKKSLMVMLASALLVSVGCTKVTDNEVRILENRINGEIYNEVKTQGVQQVLTVSTTSVPKRNLVLDVDVQPITSEKVAMETFSVKVNYGVVTQNAAIAYKQEKSRHKVVDGELYLMGEYIEDLTKASINDVVSKYAALDINNSRQLIEREVVDSVNKKLVTSGKDKFAKVNELNIIDVKPPQAIINSSMEIVTSENKLKVKQNELDVAKKDAEIQQVLAQSADPKYIALLEAEARVAQAKAIADAAKAGKLQTMIVVPDSFTSLGSIK